jgi:cardiolipin synthase
VTRKMKEIFLDDCQESIMMTPQMVNEMSRYLRFKQSFSRLLSPIL